MAIGDQHLDPETGDLRLVCKMKVLVEEGAFSSSAAAAANNHSLSSDLRGLLRDGGSTSDLLLEAR